VTLRGRAGYSLVELLVAVVILATGVLLLAGGSAVITRDLGRSRRSAVAAAAAQAKLEDLRAAAAATLPPCSAAGFASSIAPQLTDGVSLTWTVPTAGPVRTIHVVASYPLGQGRSRSDTLVGVIPC
jgi:prepilin-type N-terminal cleavage/methylation domain-containing protein